METWSTRDGPAVWLTGCSHGDEVGGIVVIHEVFRQLRRRPLRSGSVHAFPLLNPIGFESISRTIPLSEEDLNRNFPGNPDGSLAERIAAHVFGAILATKPSLVVDLHNDWRRSMPYTLIDPEPDGSAGVAYSRAIEVAHAAGFVVVRDSPGKGMEHTLSASVIRHGIPAVTLELGESYVVNETNVAFGVRAIWNLLTSLGMTEPDPEPPAYPWTDRFVGVVLQYSHEPVTSTSGIIRFLTNPGDVVSRGQKIARIHNAFGKLRETLVAPHDALVLGHADSSGSFPGVPVIAFGLLP
jgi:predicted deacylase